MQNLNTLKNTWFLTQKLFVLRLIQMIKIE
jgi:hypothetical protein